MGINWETGEIDPSVHILRPEQTVPSIREAAPGEIKYVDAESLTAATDGGLWIEAGAPTYREEEAEVLNKHTDMCRIICTQEGLLLDVSTGDFRLSGEVGERLVRNPHIHESPDEYIPVLGVIETEEQMGKIRNFIFEKYSIWIGESVLARSSDYEEPID